LCVERIYLKNNFDQRSFRQKISIYTNKKESEQVKFQEQQARQELQNEIKQIQEAHSISDESFNEAYQELAESDYEGEINPSAVAEYYIHSQAFSKAGTILTTVNPSLIKQEEIIDSLQKVIVENPQFDDNDLLELVTEVYGNHVEQTSKKVSTKVAKTAPKKKQTVNPSQVEVQDHLDWEDL
jgi:hypothetical protein